MRETITFQPPVEAAGTAEATAGLPRTRGLVVACLALVVLE